MYLMSTDFLDALSVNLQNIIAEPSENKKNEMIAEVLVFVRTHGVEQADKKL